MLELLHDRHDKNRAYAAGTDHRSERAQFDRAPATAKRQHNAHTNQHEHTHTHTQAKNMKTTTRTTKGVHTDLAHNFEHWRIAHKQILLARLIVTVVTLTALLRQTDLHTHTSARTHDITKVKGQTRAKVQTSDKKERYTICFSCLFLLYVLCYGGSIRAGSRVRL